MTESLQERECEAARMADPLYQDIMASGWSGCVSWATRQDEIRDQFEAEAGMHYAPPKSTLDRMVDDAAGYTAKYAEAFVVWVTRNMWGTRDGVPPRIAALVKDWPEESDAYNE